MSTWCRGLKDSRLIEDLRLTVGELSNAYEELALLYRLSERFSGATADEICSSVLKESTTTLELQTAAVLLIDPDTDTLYTNASSGAWDAGARFPRDDGPIWSAISNDKAYAFCKLKETDHKDYIPGAEALLICPLVGKKRAIGALVIAEQPASGEFYSNEIKLLRAITSQAALFIENAILHSEIEEFYLGTITSFVRAMEANSSWTAGHTERVTEYAMNIAGLMDLDEDTREKLKICCLLHDIGKIAIPEDILDKEGALSEEEWTAVKNHPKVGASILEGIKAFEDVILGIRFHHEWWDGSNGLYGLRGKTIPLIARIVSVADTFDAMTSDRPYRKAQPQKAVVDEISRGSGTQFDPEVVKAFLAWFSSTPNQ